MLRVQTVTASARARARAANAYIKLDIENSFPGTKMFVKARNKKNVLNRPKSKVISLIPVINIELF